MAQGKLKVKSKVPDKKKNKNNKGNRSSSLFGSASSFFIWFYVRPGNKGSVTKGPHGGGVKKAKSKKELTLQKFKKDVRKGINAHIEQQVSSKAKQVEDRTFHCAELNPAAKKGNKK